MVQVLGRQVKITWISELWGKTCVYSLLRVLVICILDLLLHVLLPTSVVRIVLPTLLLV